MNLESKVGFFVILGVVLVFALTVFFGKFDYENKHTITCYFKIANATGLNVGSHVRYKGIKVGEVEQILYDNNNIIVQLTIYARYTIPDNVTFNIKSGSFVGAKHVDLAPDPKIISNAYLLNDFEYDGKQEIGSSLDNAISSADDVMQEVTRLVRSLNDIISPDSSKTSLKSAIGNIETITNSIDTLIADNTEKISKLIDGVNVVLANINALVNTNKGALNSSMDNIEAITADLKLLTSTISSMINDNASNGQLNALGSKVNDTLKNINQITKDINDGKGTIGLLINDEETKENIKNVVNSVSSFFNGSQEEERFKFYASIGADYLFDGKGVHAGRGYMNLALYQDPRNFYLLGVGNVPVISPNPQFYDSFGNRIKNSQVAFSLQYSHIFAKIFGLRLGLFDNTLGVAADLYPLRNNNLVISLEAYDFNVYPKRLDTYLKALVRWYFYKGIYIQAGVEDIIGNTNRVYMVGAGFRLSPSDMAKKPVEKVDAKKAKAKVEPKKAEAKAEIVVPTAKKVEPIEQNIKVKEGNKEDKRLDKGKKQDKKENRGSDYFDSLVFG